MLIFHCWHDTLLQFVRFLLQQGVPPVVLLDRLGLGVKPHHTWCSAAQPEPCTVPCSKSKCCAGRANVQYGCPVLGLHPGYLACASNNEDVHPLLMRLCHRVDVHGCRCHNKALTLYQGMQESWPLDRGPSYTLRVYGLCLPHLPDSYGFPPCLLLPHHPCPPAPPSCATRTLH